MPLRIRPHVVHPLADAAFLVVLVAVSLALYVGGLGFYSDDWAFLGLLRNGADQSLWGLIELQHEGNPNLRLRPTQVVFQALLYEAFGLEPLGYHVVNAAVLATLAVVFLLVLRELGLPRALAVSIPAVYVLLPHYSTNRFWFASFGYALSIALVLLALYADLRGARAEGRAVGTWKALAAAALVAALWGYEVVLPFALAMPAVVEWHARRRGRTRGLLGTAAFHAPTLAVVAAAAAYKAANATSGLAGDAGYYLKQLFFGSLTISFGSYGVMLPEAVWWSLGRLDAAALAAGALATLLVFAYVHALARSPSTALSRRAWLAAGVAGLVVFALGYAIFLTTVRILFTSTGIANRSTMAGALGVAIVFVAAAGLLATLVPRARAAVFAGAVAAVCGAGFAIDNALARSWVEAWQEERRVLAAIRAALPDPAPKTTVLLDGVCPYRGPAIVFESNWDLAGALRAHYRDPTIAADTTQTTLTVGRKGISTLLYGVIAAHYPYSPRLLVFAAESATLHPVPSRRAFLEYRARRGPTSCPPGEPGKGVRIFSTDRLYDRFEARGFPLPP